MKKKYIFYVFNILNILFLCLILAPAIFQPYVVFSQTISLASEKNKTFGSEFIFSIPPSPTITDNQVILTIIPYTSTNVKITGRYGFMQNLYLAPYEKTTVVLPAHSAFPYLKSERDKPVADAVYDAALRITSDETITVTATVKNNKNSEGFVVLPVEVLGTKYIVSSYNDATHYISKQYNNIVSLPSIVAITAAYDATEVKFKLGGNAQTSSAGGIKVYEEVSKILNSGEVWVISTNEDDGDLSGSVISSSLPISVVSSNQCANIPLDNSPCNYLVEMEIPTQVFGKKFIIPALPDRKYNSVLRIFAAEDSTKIQLSGQETPIVIAKSGGTIHSGFAELRPNQNGNAKHTVITSNKPISITFYNTGGDEDSTDNNVPFQMLLTPQEQLINSYIFAIPERKGTKLFEKNTLCLIFETSSTIDTLLPEDIKFEIFNGVSWQPAANDFKEIAPITPVNYVINGKNYAVAFYDVQTLSTCRIFANSNFALYLFGQSDMTGASSGAYGTMIGSGLLDINSGDTLAPIPTWEMLCNGDVVGKTIDAPENSSNCSNLTLPIFYSQLSYNYDKQFGTIIPGITNEVNWNLFVRDKNADAKAVIKFGDRAGNDTIIHIQYFAPKILINPDQINFNTVKFGTSSKQNISIKNESLADFNIVEYVFKQYPQMFKLIDPPYGTLLPEEEKTFKIEFIAGINSEVKKTLKDTLYILDRCNSQKKIIIEANIENPEIFADDVNFSECLLNTTIYQKCKITNIGSCDLVVYNYTPPQSDNFTINFPQNIDFPVIIKAGSSLFFNVGFTPKNTINYLDSIVFHSDAIGIDSITKITGIGVNPGLIAESYSWDKARVYRKEFPTQPIPIKNEAGGLKIINKSNFDIKLENITITDTNNSKSGFLIDEVVVNSLIGKVIRSEEEVILPVDFFPLEKRDYNISLNYISSGGVRSTSSLYGKGVLPDYTVSSQVFDTLLINDFTNPQTRSISIQNLRDNYNNDTLHIFNITSPDNSVSISNNSYSHNGFKISLPENIFPIKIPPGEVFSFDCDFVPTKIGENVGQLLAITDAITDHNINIIGYGAGKNILSQSSDLTICQGEKGIIKCTIKNNGNNNLRLENFYMSPNIPVFSFQNAPKDTIVPPGNALVLEIYFAPQTLGTYNTFVHFTASGANYIFADSVKITASSHLVTCLTDIQLSDKKISIGKPLLASINLQNGEILKELNINNFNINIKYNADIITPDISNINIGRSLSGKFFIEEYTLDRKNKNLTVSLKSIAGGILSTTGELLTIYFDTFFPLENTNIVDISASVISTNSCASFIPSISSAEISGVCALDLRRIKLSPTSYYLDPITPNPIQNSTIKIKFGIGLDCNSQTKLNIYSSKGELISNPICQNLEIGTYELELDIKNLTSGTYYYSISSGPYNKTEKFILIK